MNKKTIIPLIVFVLGIVGVIAAVILVRLNQDIREKAAPATNLTFNPSSLNVIKGNNFVINSKLSSGENIVTGIDIELTYDPNAIRINTITPTQALSPFTDPSSGSVIRNQIDNVAGNARFVAYTFDKTKGIIGTYDILQISATSVNNTALGNYSIRYGPLTAVAAVNEGQNAILSKSDATIIIVSPSPTPSPTPTKSPSPTPTPTKSPSPTPTPTKSPSPTPTSSPSPTPLPKVGDVNNDGFVNMIDIVLVIDEYGSTNPTNPRLDIDKSGRVDIIDIGIIVDNYEG